ncbi:MAG: signal peptidase II [Desulfomonilaceae bacterium]|nr:signal peptidase II [Desulfomonilaceae bacterium]
MKNSTKFLIFALIVLAVTVVDQASKYLVVSSIALNSGFELVPGYLDIVHVRNKGAAFGLLSQSTWAFRSTLFLVVSLVALIVILRLLAVTEAPDWYLLGGYSLFFGGALGNLIDRLRFDEVIDFLDVHIGNLHWPAFNVADSALCVGAVLFFVHFVRAGRRVGRDSGSAP